MNVPEVRPSFNAPSKWFGLGFALAVSFGLLAAFLLWGVALGRAHSCASQLQPDYCTSLDRLMISTLIASLVISVTAVVALVRGLSVAKVLIPQSVALITLVAVTIWLTAPGVLWG